MLSALVRFFSCPESAYNRKQDVNRACVRVVVLSQVPYPLQEPGHARPNEHDPASVVVHLHIYVTVLECNIVSVCVCAYKLMDV